MFGPYKITHKGRAYYGNVSLKEYHIVQSNGEYTLFLAQDVKAVPISRQLVQAIVRLMPSPGTLIPDGFMQALREVGLVREGTEKSVSEKNSAPSCSNEPLVTNMALFVTQTCNMRCFYCYGNGGEYGQRGVMTQETAFQAVEWLMKNSKDAGKVNIGFFGGEPLMNFPLIQQVVAYAKAVSIKRDKEITFNMTTNASLLTHKVITFMKNEKIDALISFDGPPEIQNRQRPFRNGRGSYNRVFANVRRLRAAIPNLSARATLCGDSDPFVVRNAMDEAGFAHCHLMSASPSILGRRDSAGAAEYKAKTSQLRSEKMIAYNKAEMENLLDDIKNRRIDPEYPPAALTVLADLVRSQRRHVGCGAGRGMRAVSVDGHVYPCHRLVGLEDFRLGHILDYRGDEINEYHRAVVENLPACRACWARYLCGGGCFYNNLAYTGDMRRPEPSFCREMKALADDAIRTWRRLTEDGMEYLKDLGEKMDSHLKP